MDSFVLQLNLDKQGKQEGWTCALLVKYACSHS